MSVCRCRIRHRNVNREPSYVGLIRSHVELQWVPAFPETRHRPASRSSSKVGSHCLVTIDRYGSRVRRSAGVATPVGEAGAGAGVSCELHDRPTGVARRVAVRRRACAHRASPTWISTCIHIPGSEDFCFCKAASRLTWITSRRHYAEELQRSSDSPATRFAVAPSCHRL